MTESNTTRRRALEILAVGGLTVTILIPSKWIKPIVGSIIVPAHAQASPAKAPIEHYDFVDNRDILVVLAIAPVAVADGGAGPGRMRWLGFPRRGG
jgi:hypothetical protein